MRIFLPAAGFFGCIAIIFSALGVHDFSHTLPVDHYFNFLVAVSFQLFHSIVLLALGLFAYTTRRRFYLLIASGYFFILGIVFFCGDIYLSNLLSLEGMRYLDPIGGFALIIGWALIFIAGIRYYFHTAHIHDM